MKKGDEVLMYEKMMEMFTVFTTITSRRIVFNKNWQNTYHTESYYNKTMTKKNNSNEKTNDLKNINHVVGFLNVLQSTCI